MAYVFIPHKSLKSELHMIIIAKSWPMKFMMNRLVFVKSSPIITFSTPPNLGKIEMCPKQLTNGFWVGSHPTKRPNYLSWYFFMPFSQNAIDLDWLIWKPKASLKSCSICASLVTPNWKVFLLQS